MGGSASSKDVRILVAGSWQSIPLSGLGQFSIPGDLPVDYYLIEIDRTIQGASSEYHHTSGFVFNYNTGNTGIANTSAEAVCVGELVGFEVTSSVMATNYPGSLYSIFYGDTDQDIPETTEYYTHSRLQICNTLNHVYELATCSSDFKDENVDEDGFYYKLDLKLLNKGIYDDELLSDNFLCNEYSQNSNGTTKWVNVSLQPSVDFETEPVICAGTVLSANDISLVGAFGYGAECLTEYSYYWDVLFPGASAWDTVTDDLGWIDVDGNLNIPGEVTLDNPGCWEIQLKINNPAGCVQSDIVVKTVIVEPQPLSNFTYNPTSLLCAPQVIDFTNTSNTENFSEACGNPVYTWTVTPVEAPATLTGFDFIVDPNLMGDPINYVDPSINFTQPGTYSVVLNTSNTCGDDDSEPVLIEIIGDPTVNFPTPFFAACQGLAGQTADGFILDFLNNTPISPVYSEAPFEPTTFTWTITGPGVTAADYTFWGGTDASSEFPIIKFLSYNTYTITVEVDGNCANSNSDTLTFLYEQTPIITNTDTQQDICTGDTTQLVQFTSDMDPATDYIIFVNVNPEISGYDATLNSGDTIPVMTLINSTNVPQDLVYSVAPVVNNCQGGTVNFTFTVNPEPLIPNQTDEICSEETFIVSPVNNPPTTIVPADTTYTWTVVDNPNVEGDLDETTPQTSISQTLTNITNTVQTVDYIVTPTSGADGFCVGDDFTLTVSVNPKPFMDPFTHAPFCSNFTFIVLPIDGQGNTNSDIVPVGTTYTWTVVDVNGLVTGDSDVTIGQTSISQNLINISDVPQTLVYTVTPTSGDVGACVGDPFIVTFTVNPAPVIPNQTDEICSDETFTVNPTNNPPTTIVPTDTTYTWTVVDNPNVDGELDETTPQTSISQTLTNTTNTVQTVDYIVTPTSGADGFCVGEDFTLTVSVNPKPFMDPFTHAPFCSNFNFVVFPIDGEGDTNSDIVPVGTTYTWTVVDVNGLVTGDSDVTIGQTSISQTLINISDVPQTLVYTVTPTSGDVGACVGDPFIVTFTVNPAPVIPNQTAEICSSEIFTVTPLNNPPTTIIPADTTYTWAVVDNPNVDGELDETTPQTSISQTLTNTTNTVQTVDYIVTPTSGADGFCVGEVFTVTVQVNPEPVIQPVNFGAICSGTAFTVIPTNDGGSSLSDIVPVNTTYIWTVVDNPNVEGDLDEVDPQTSISQILTNLTNTVQTVDYIVTPTSGADGFCVGADFTLTVSVNPKPFMDPFTHAPFCSNFTFIVLPIDGQGNTNSDIVPVGTTYTWTVVDVNGLVTGDSDVTIGQTSISQNLINISDVPQTLVYTVTPTSGDVGACVGDPFIVTFTVNPAPVIPNQTDEICSDETFTVNPTNNPPTTIVPTDTTYIWTVVDNPNVEGELDETTPQTSISQTLTNTTNTVQTVDYIVTPTSGADGFCVGEDFTLTVSVNPKPFMDPFTHAPFCSNFNFVVFPIDGQGDTNSDIVPVGTTYTWTVVDVNGLVTGDSDVTIGQTSISQTLINISDVPQTLVYTVTPTSGDVGACVGDPFIVTFTVNPAPVIPNQTAEICSSEIFTVTPLNNPPTTIIPADTTYTWAVVDNPNVDGELDETTPQTSISQTLTNTTNTVQTVDYIVTPTSGADGFCVGEVFTVTVQVNPEPVIQPVNFGAICSGTAFTVIPTNDGGSSLSDIVPVNTTYIWTVADANGLVTGYSDETTAQTSISQTLTNTSIVTQTVVYTVTPTSGAQGNCEGLPFTISVDVDPRPIMNPIDPQTICGGTAFTTPVLGADVAGTDYNWILLNVAMIPATITGYPTDPTQALVGTTIFNSGDDAYTLTYEFTPSFNGCVGPSKFFDITVEPAPSVDFDILDQSVCSGGTSVQVNLDSETAPVDISWTIDPTLYPAITGITTTAGTIVIPAFNLSNSGSTPVDLIFSAEAVTTSAGACLGSPVFYTITVNPAAEMDAVNNVVFCNGETTPEITFSTPLVTGNTTYEWTIDTNIGLAPLADTGAIPSFIAVNTTNDPIIATVTVEPIFSNATDPTVECDGVQQVFTITINPSPQITNTLDSQTICSEDSSTAVEWTSSIVNGTPTEYNWTFVSATAGITGHVTDPNVGDLPVFPLLSNSSNTIGELVYEVIPTSLGCAGDPFLYTIFINPVIAITNTETSQTLCSGDISAEVVWENTNAALAVVYNWVLDASTVPAGTTGLETVGTGNLSAMTVDITAIVTTNIDYIVTPNFDGCDGTPFTYTLTIDPLPIMIPIAPQTICGGTAFTTPILDADVIGTVYEWVLLDVGMIPATVTGYPTDVTQALVGTTILNSGTAAYTLTYEFTPSFNGCIGFSKLFDITINPSPTVTLTLDTQEICSGATSLPFTASSATDPSTTYEWNVISGAAALDATDPITGNTNAIPSFTVTNFGVTPIAIEIEVIASTTGGAVCPGTPTIHTINVVPDPEVIIDSALPTDICIGGSISDIEVSTSGGTGTVSFEWYISDALGTLISIHPNSTDSATFNPGVFTTAGQYHFVAVANFDGSGCDQAQSLDVIVEVVEDPILTAPLAFQELCEGTASTDLEVIATGGTGTYSYQWFSNTTNTNTGRHLNSRSYQSSFHTRNHPSRDRVLLLCCNHRRIRM